MGCKSSILASLDPVSKKSSSVGSVKEQCNVISIKSAILIQKWYRCYQARLEARRRCTWMIYQSLEYSGEQNQLKLHNFFMGFLNLVAQKNDTENPLFTQALDKSQSLERTHDENTIPLEDDYNGPELHFPIHLQNITSVIEAFVNKQIMHPHYLFNLLMETREKLKSKPNVMQADICMSNKITVCGDLHGQLQDLLYIFEKNQIPDITNPYIFNGDFVDRGEHSVEILVILFSFFLLYPNSVFLNRGNHEDKVMNMRYGFIKEVQLKYKDHANDLLNLFADVFRWLPLATVIEKKIFICHGGISNRIQINNIDLIDRTKFVSVLSCNSEARDELNEWMQILDLLWSDPKPQKGCKPNQFRGGGCYFGPDITRKFLDQHQFKMLVRSHECKPEGFEWCHDKSVLTIFSASNYYDVGSNKGAYVQFFKNLSFKIMSFNASKDHQGPIPRNHNIFKVEESAMKVLRNKILTSRSELMQEFMANDPSGSGKLNVTVWGNIMSRITELDLPWHTLKHQLVVVDSDTGLIEYASSFEMLLHKTSSTTDSQISEEIYKYRDTLETVFRILDNDNSGKISLDEFKEGCIILRKQGGVTMTTEAMEDLARSIDINKDGFIDLNEFLEAFRINEENYK